jgi:hypothetical protein
MSCITTFFLLGLIHRLFFLGLYPSSAFKKSLKKLKTLKITSFQRMDLPLSSGKRGGETPNLLDPVD